MKNKMEKDSGSSNKSVLEAQFQWIIKVITDRYDIEETVMRRSTQEGFVEVRNKLDYFYNDVLQKAPEGAAIQEFPLISTDP